MQHWEISRFRAKQTWVQRPMNEKANSVCWTQWRKGSTNNQGGNHKRDIGYSHADTLLVPTPYGSCFQISQVKQHFKQSRAMVWLLLLLVDRIKSCQLHNPFIDSQTSWYLLLTTTVIILGSAHPCWILATGNLKTHLISWYIIPLWLLSKMVGY